jgi:hypothetical protein
MQEPRDGDFVAYIEALQRESAARLAQARVHVDDAAPTGQASGHFFEKDKAARAASPAALQQTVERIVRGDTDAKTVKALVAGVVGAVFLLTWLADGGPFAFILAVALLAYAVPRLLAAFRAGVRPPSNRAAVDQVFGRSGSTTPGTKP